MKRRPPMKRSLVTLLLKRAHPAPESQFDPQGTDALIAYLLSIQTSAP
jgi:hypothetical protein